MTDYVHWRIEIDAEDIAWLTLDTAGSTINTLSSAVLAEFARVLEEASAMNPCGLIIRSGKPSGFVAGADIKEFSLVKSAQEAKHLIRLGWDPFNKLERMPIPTVALIDGFCIGGGLELALACRYRIAVDDPNTRFSLPEVSLGIWPLMGGVMRLSRLVPAPQALDMMLTGRSVDARRARRLGLVDIVVPARVAQNAARLTVLAPPKPRRLPLVASLMNLPLVRPLVAKAAEKQLARRVRRENYPAPYAMLEAWARYLGDPFRIPDDDPASIASLLRSPTAANLIRVFFLQERLKSLAKQASFDARHVHVIGAGAMGGDIAAVCAMRGFIVTLQDQTAEKIAPAMRRSQELFKRRLRDRIQIRDAFDRLIPDITGDGISRADVVIEAIYENLEAKRALFARLARMARPGAILATNTSSLKISDIGVNMDNPSRLVGMHFFNPVPQMHLVEIVSASITDPSIAAKAAAFVRSLDKLPLAVKDAPGFLVNRVLGPYLHQALRMTNEGVAPETLDAAMERFGMPVGPIELADMVGLDICLAVARELAGGAAPPSNLEALVRAGNLGKKSGRGFYDWAGGKPRKRASGAVSQDLIDSLIEPYLKEALAAVSEGIVADADCADAGRIFGTGFAPFRGGPLHYLAERSRPLLHDP
jgi:3-hydroxyacyl-CoA dehydrogenase/enoyl-CoA hydratase/3-hydroxybutyryl-CoA epimerase